MQWGKPSGQLFCVMLSCVVLCMSAVGKAFRSVVLCYVVLCCLMYECSGESLQVGCFVLCCLVLSYV